MKKIKFEGRLSLNKETIATLNEDQMNSIKGGDEYGNNALSLGKWCTRSAQRCLGDDWTRGVFCNKNSPLE